MPALIFRRLLRLLSLRVLLCCALAGGLFYVGSIYPELATRGKKERTPLKQILHRDSIPTAPKVFPEKLSPPKEREVTKQPEAPDATAQPEAPDATAQPEAPDATAQPEATETTAQPKAPKATALPEAPKATAQPEAPEATAQPEATETTAQPKAQKATAQPEAPEATAQPEAPEDNPQVTHPILTRTHTYKNTMNFKLSTTPITMETNTKPAEGGYIRFDNYYLTGENIKCKEKDCESKKPEEAKALCDAEEKCHAFVLTFSNALELKFNTSAIIKPQPGSNIYVKRQYATRLSLPQDVCAVKMPKNISTDVSQGCKMAEFDPFNPEIMGHVHKPAKPLQCHGQPLTTYRNGMLKFLNEQNLKINRSFYQPITRIPEKDWGYNLGNETQIDVHKRKLPIPHEFIRVETRSKDGETRTEFHAAVVPNPQVMERPHRDTGIPVNVMMIGFDSLSAAHFKRVFTKANSFLSKELNTVFMKGYSIVGDGTTPALTAFLAGQFEKELPEARRGYENSDTVDKWPWVFKDYKSAGYATLFSEDCPGYGAFNYRLHGFKQPPTDHFGRYFWEAARLTSPYCIHSKPQHRIHFDYIESFFEAYPKKRKFGLSFFTDISHNNLNSIYHSAEDFFRLLKNLHQANHLNNTILITFGDHGFRYGSSRTTLQGHLEERLPHLAFTFPYWFEAEYPDVVENLRDNSETVTSPFDLYATLKHILLYPESPTGLKRGMSMFNEIPKTRGCEAAGVAEHYCPCLNLKPADPNHGHIRRSAEAVVKFINDLTSSDPKSSQLCERLSLKAIKSSHQQMANTKFAQFLGSRDAHGREPMFLKGKVVPHECNYRIQVETTPGDALFDVAVRYLDGEFRVSGDISRINMYGEQPRCILSSRPDLRKYCLCKDYKKAVQ
ncbi:uncharacterized protein LOC5514659 isoform X2 [Nematostella vectensis]|nr:uncharacterized protein LOC5514659 isoform X2 [Nematostella vectensis]